MTGNINFRSCAVRNVVSIEKCSNDNGVIKAFPSSSGCWFGPSSRFNISLEKEPQRCSETTTPEVSSRCRYGSCVPPDHTPNFRHFLLVTGRQECATCGPRSLSVQSSLHVRASALTERPPSSRVPPPPLRLLNIPHVARRLCAGGPPPPTRRTCGRAKPPLTHRLVAVASKLGFNSFHSDLTY